MKRLLAKEKVSMTTGCFYCLTGFQFFLIVGDQVPTKISHRVFLQISFRGFSMFLSSFNIFQSAGLQTSDQRRPLQPHSGSNRDDVIETYREFLPRWLKRFLDVLKLSFDGHT